MVSRAVWRLDLSVALIAGSIFAWHMLGWRVLDPRRIDWMVNDVPTYFVGWEFLRHRSGWHWPLTWLPDLNYPFGIPAALLDIDPLVALALKPLAPLLPDPFQYFGLEGWGACVLQCLVGTRWTRRLTAGGVGHVAHLAAWGGGLLFLLAPPFMFRLWCGHFALVQHWPVLAALGAIGWLERGSPRRLAGLALLVVLSGMINPYIAFMTLIGCAAALIQAGLDRQWHWPTLAWVGLLLLVAALVPMIALGFVGGDSSAFSGVGYRSYSLNLLAPIDPGQFGSPLLPSEPSFPYQYEGYNYLGAGVILLGLAALIRRPAGLRWLAGPSAAMYRLIFWCCLILALSARVTLGHLILIDIPLPSSVIDALATFRASGRLFWPGFYLLLAAAIAGAWRGFGPKIGLAVIMAACLIQIADTWPLQRASITGWTEASHVSPLRSAQWHDLGRTFRHLQVEPATQCDISNLPDDPYWALDLLAAQQHMSVNTVYAARMTESALTGACEDDIVDLLTHAPKPDTAYVFKPMAALPYLAQGPLACEPVDGLLLCRPGVVENRARNRLDAILPVLTPAATLDMAAPQSSRFMLSGWGLTAPTGHWTSSTQAYLVLRLPAGGPHKLILDIDAAYPTADGTDQRLMVTLNGQRLASAPIPATRASHIAIDVPTLAAGQNGLPGDIALLRLDCPDAVPVRAAGGGRLRIGVLVRAIGLAR